MLHSSTDRRPATRKLRGRIFPCRTACNEGFCPSHHQEFFSKPISHFGLGRTRTPEYCTFVIVIRPCKGAGGSHVVVRGGWEEIMSFSGWGNTGGGWRNDGGPNFQPHAFDPYLQPELFRG